MIEVSAIDPTEPSAFVLLMVSTSPGAQDAEVLTSESQRAISGGYGDYDEGQNASKDELLWYSPKLDSHLDRNRRPQPGGAALNSKAKVALEAIKGSAVNEITDYYEVHATPVARWKKQAVEHLQVKAFADGRKAPENASR